MQTDLLRVFCEKNNISYIIFDPDFSVIDAKNIKISKGSDLREFLWEIVGMEEKILKLSETKESFEIPMISRDENYYDLSIEPFKNKENRPLFIAYIQQKSKQTHNYADAIKEINKKTLIYDTSEEKKASSYYQQINKRFITLHVDLEGIIKSVNETCCHFFHLKKEEMINKHFTLFFDAQKSQLDHETNIFIAKESANKSIFFHVDIIPLHNAQGEIKENIFIAKDISYLKEVQKELEFASEHDTLTGLPNRHALLKSIDQAIEEHSAFGIVFIDIDAFHTINEEYGAHAGDMLLKYLTELVTRLKDPQDLFARLQNDTFVLLFDPQKSKNYIHTVVQNIQELQKRPLIYSAEDTIEFQLTTLLLWYPDDAKSAQEFLRVAQKDMEKCKLSRKL